MKYLGLVTLFIGAALCSDVLDLTDSNFKSEVDDKDIILLEFYAPWCGHCKRLAPEYEIAATALKKNDPPISIAKIDCTEGGKDVCSANGVSGYPTLKIFRNGAFAKDYDGPRDAQGIIAYMKKNAGPSSITLKDSDHLNKKLESAEDNVIVGFFSEENALHGQFLKAADQKRTEFNFAHSIDADINKEAGHENVIVIYRPKVLHAKFEDSKEVLDTDGASTTDILTFIKDKNLGLVGQMKQDNIVDFVKPYVIVYFAVDWRKNPKGTKYWRNRVARVAKKFKGEINFGIAAKSDFDRQMNDYGFMDKDEVNAVALNSKGLVFKMADKFDVPNFEKFVNEFKNGDLKAYVKSEPIPENNDGPVKVIVGENFDAIVNDPTKDVLIEFYAPWCGHCKTLEPKYLELGDKLKENKDIVIAKMDATANDAPSQYNVQGFPTIYWAPAGNKETPKKYEGGREVDDFIEFIKKEATNPVVLGGSKKKSKKAKVDL